MFNTARHMFVKHGCPRRQQSPNMATISKHILRYHNTFIKRNYIPNIYLSMIKDTICNTLCS